MRAKGKLFDAHVKVFDLMVDCTQKEEVLKILGAQLGLDKSDRLVSVATLNPEQVVQAHHHPAFKRALQRFSVVVADGIGLVWAIHRLTGQQIDRITGVDLAAELVAACQTNHWPIFFLGGRLNRQTLFSIHNSTIPVHAPKAASATYYTPGATDISTETKVEEKRVLDAIERFRPRLLLIAYGAPRQELWLDKHRQRLEKAGVQVAMVVGGSFDYWSGRVPRAPLWLRSLGLEWLFRLVRQPWRWHRQLRLIEFVSLVFGTRD